jgi:hypothetical protein
MSNQSAGTLCFIAPNLPKKARDSLRQIEQRYKSSYDRQVPLKDETLGRRDAARVVESHVEPERRDFVLHPKVMTEERRRGHVVGLGDRHVSNILMDEARGELVHIDLGIAFDQG